MFLNRRRTHLKLLHWEPGGFVCYYKRLEEGTFTPPELAGMVEGIQVERSRQKRRYHR